MKTGILLSGIPISKPSSHFPLHFCLGEAGVARSAYRCGFNPISQVAAAADIDHEGSLMSARPSRKGPPVLDCRHRNGLPALFENFPTNRIG